MCISNWSDLFALPVLESGPAGTAGDRLSSERHSDPADTGHIDRYYPYYNLRYNPSAPFIRSGFLVSYRIRSAMKFSQNVLHYIVSHTSRVYVIHIKSLSRYFQLTQDWTYKAKWRSIEASYNVNKHTRQGLLAVLNELAPRMKLALVEFNSADGSGSSYTQRRFPWRCFNIDWYRLVVYINIKTYRFFDSIKMPWSKV